MADWTFTTANALAAQQWANKWWIGVKTQSFFYDTGLVGSDENNDVIVEFPELANNQGYKVTYGQVRELSGSGITGDSDMETQEEAPDTYDDDIELNQKRNAIRTNGKLSEQYPSDKRVRMWALELLERWKAGIIDQDIFTALGTSCTKIIYGGDATATTDIEAGDYMTLQLISKAVAFGKKATPKISGKSKGGSRKMVCVMAIDQAFDLRMRDAAWAQAQREAQMRGDKNPIFEQVMGTHDKTDLFEHEKVSVATTWGSGSTLNGALALFMGVGAGAIAYSKKKIWNEKTFDYGNKVGFCIGSIYGVSKSVFNASDNAVVGIATYRTSN
jgi:N4-gp56 family major capsid protein